jgi:hypothetical protein
VEVHSRVLLGREKSHQLDKGSLLGGGGVFPPERRGICIIPSSRHGPWRPMIRQAKDQNSGLRRESWWESSWNHQSCSPWYA